MLRNQPQNSRHKYIIALELGLLFGILIVLGSTAADFIVHAQTSPKPEVILPGPTIKADIAARAGFVFDVKTNDVLFVKNAEEILPLASLTKIMTTLVAMKGMSATSTVPIRKSSISQAGDNGLLQGERWQLADLLKFTLIESSNDGAHAVAAAFESSAPKGDFVEQMNISAKQLGFSNMLFYNETGLDINSKLNGGYGSAKDTARLFSYAVQNFPEIFKPTSLGQKTFITNDGLSHTAYNTDSALPEIPEAIASKTGYTLLAGGNLALEFRAKNGDPIVAVVLGSSQEGRFSDIMTLVEGTRNAFSTAPVSE